METKFIILEEVVMVNVSEIEHTCAWMHQGAEIIGTVINFKSGREVTTSESMEVVRDKILQAINGPVDHWHELFDNPTLNTINKHCKIYNEDEKPVYSKLPGVPDDKIIPSKPILVREDKYIEEFGSDTDKSLRKSIKEAFNRINEK